MILREEESMRSQELRTVLQSGRVLICDGAMGTFLQEKGLQPGECPELWCVERPDDVQSIHTAYREAGSDLVECNSFGGTRYKLDAFGLGDRVRELNRAAAAVARKAAGPDQFVLGSMGPTGQFMEPLGPVSAAAMEAAFREQAEGLAEGGADAVIIETMTALDEALAALRAVRSCSELVAFISFTFDPQVNGGYATMMGVRPDAFAGAAVEAGADVIGTNCGTGPEDMTGIVAELRAAALAIPIIAMPNAGMPELVNGATVFRQSPADMAARVPDLMRAGATVIGGCCGTGPAHIAAMRAVVPRR